VEDSLAVGQRRQHDTDERVVLFLKMAPGHAFSKELVDKIKGHIRRELSPRHVPAFVLPISDIPVCIVLSILMCQYTINGKKVEVAVKKIVSGESVVPSGTLSNPECLKLYENIPELQ
jgi:acetoacetyl-CoA synthetase